MPTGQNHIGSHYGKRTQSPRNQCGGTCVNEKVQLRNLGNGILWRVRLLSDAGHLAEPTGMTTVEGHGHRNTNGTRRPGVLYQHARPGNRLQNGPMKADGNHQRSEKQPSGQSNQHRRWVTWFRITRPEKKCPLKGRSPVGARFSPVIRSEFIAAAAGR